MSQVGNKEKATCIYKSALVESITIEIMVLTMS